MLGLLREAGGWELLRGGVGRGEEWKGGGLGRVKGEERGTVTRVSLFSHEGTEG